MREDYSADGDAWAYFPFEQASGRAYRWGEDGIAGMSDDEQLICLALALWNGRDPILKERLFGLFLRDQDGRRAVFGENVKLQDNEHFRDYLQFHEFFHGDTGRGLGASHQTGWTGVAWLLMPRKQGG